MGRLEFTVGEAFPADDPVARWVVILSIIGSDLARVHKRLYTVTQLGNEEDRPHAVYWVLLGASHLREAVKFLDPTYCELTDSDEVRSFLARTSPETQRLLQEVRDEFIPWEGSWLHRVTKPSRDRVFHYATEDGEYGEEVREALHAMREWTSHIDVVGRNLDWHSFVGTEVRLNWIGMAGGLSESDLGKLVNKSNKLCGRITSLSVRITLAYLDERIGIGEDAKTIGVYIPSPDSELADEIRCGAGVVGALVGDTERLRLDYEDDDEVYPEYVDRVEQAAKRHLAVRPAGRDELPSTVTDPDEVIRVGRWDPVAGELEVTDEERLNNWRG